MACWPTASSRRRHSARPADGANQKGRRSAPALDPVHPEEGSALGLGGLGLAVLGLVVPALGDARGLAAAVAQVIQLGAADGTAADDLDRVDARAIQREDALDALAIADLADGEVAVQAGILAADADALISLHALARAFDDLDVHLDGVAGLEVRDLAVGRQLVDLFLLDRLNDVHGSCPSCSLVSLRRSRPGRFRTWLP